jgi:hypothetical protein
MKSDIAAINDYFLKLAGYGSAFLDRLPIELEPQPLEYALAKLAPHLKAQRADELARLRQISRPMPARESSPVAGVGLNTVGMLTDRFTILLIKEWCLRHKGAKNAAKADELFQNQTRDIAAALAATHPGSSSLNSKITKIKSSASAQSWEEAFWGLLAINLVLWESQEMLYIKDIGGAPEDELRSYIRWFSSGNIERNDYIELCERWYWTPAGAS